MPEGASEHQIPLLRDSGASPDWFACKPLRLIIYNYLKISLNPEKFFYRKVDIFVRKSLISAFSPKILYKKCRKNIFGSNFGEFSKILSVLALGRAPRAEDSRILRDGAPESCATRKKIPRGGRKFLKNQKPNSFHGNQLLFL